MCTVCWWGLVPGPSGLLTDHLHYIMELDAEGLESVLATLVTELVVKLVNAILPQDLSVYFCGARLVPLLKKKGGIRPLAIGEILKLVAHTTILIDEYASIHAH